MSYFRVYVDTDSGQVIFDAVDWSEAVRIARCEVRRGSEHAVAVDEDDCHVYRHRVFERPHTYCD